MSTVIAVISAVGSTVMCSLGVLSFLNHRFDRRFDLMKKAIESQDAQVRLEAAERHAMDKRLQVIETKVNLLPTNDRVDRLFEVMSQMGSRIAVVETSSKATASGVQRIENYLLDKGKS
jgi:hypothetical protein